MNERQTFMGMARDLGLDDKAAKMLWDQALAAMGSVKATFTNQTLATASMFKIGDLVRLKSESRMMTVSGATCVDVACMWMDGDRLEEADFHRDMLTADPYPDPVPF